MNLILTPNNMNRITWFDEGMALLFSKENDSLNNSENFKNWFKKVKESTKILPDLNSLEHGSNFQTAYYNCYNLSYLCVRYLYETLGVEEFKKIMKNEEVIKSYGKSIQMALDYFSPKYCYGEDVENIIRYC